MKRPAISLVIAAALTLILWVMPFGSVLALPLLWLSTLAHELGHGLAAILVGGSFDALQIFFDGSGVASCRYDKSAQPWVSLGGLLGPALVAMFLFVAGVLQRPARAILGGAGLVSLGLCVTVIDGAFALSFALLLGLFLLAWAWQASAPAAQVTVLFLAVQLSLSVFSSSDYLFVATARTGAGEMPSDIAQVATHFGGPILFWGAVVAAFSVLVLVAGIVLFAWGDALHARLTSWQRRRQGQQMPSGL